MNKPEPMTCHQAVLLGRLVLEFEAENTDFSSWRRECREAAAVLRSVQTKPPEWVTRQVEAGQTNFNLMQNRK